MISALNSLLTPQPDKETHWILYSWPTKISPILMPLQECLVYNICYLHSIPTMVLTTYLHTECSKTPCRRNFTSFIKNYFSQSLDSLVLPTDWSVTNVCPIHKKGSHTEPSNYRPISLTSICCKVMEHISYHHRAS